MLSRGETKISISPSDVLAPPEIITTTIQTALSQTPACPLRNKTLSSCANPLIYYEENFPDHTQQLHRPPTAHSSTIARHTSDNPQRMRVLDFLLNVNPADFQSLLPLYNLSHTRTEEIAHLHF